MSPKVSIVIPSLNSINYIEECLQSVLNQTLQDIEILCVDANSTDGTLEYLQDLEKKDKRLQVIVSQKKSYGYQMNLGIKEAKGEYLGIVESDDYIKLTMYEDLYKIAKETQVEVLKCDLENFTTDKFGKKHFAYANLAYDKSLYGKVLIKDESAGALGISLLKDTWNMNQPGLYSLNFIKKFRLKFNESAGASYQDTGFWFAMQVLARSFYYLPQAFYYYRRDNENSSCNSKGKVYAICGEYDFIREFLESHHQEKPKYLGILNFLRFNAYRWNLNRIAEEYKLEFIEKFAADFDEIIAKGELDRSYFDGFSLHQLQQILENPKEFYKNTYCKPSGAVKRVKNHLSYKLGNAIVKSKNPLRILALPFMLIQVLINHKIDERINAAILRFRPEMSSMPLESYGDYAESLKIKEHLSYKLGKAFLKNPLTFPLKIPNIYKNFKRNRGNR